MTPEQRDKLAIAKHKLTQLGNKTYPQHGMAAQPQWVWLARAEQQAREVRKLIDEVLA